jgi:hypothetical protein
MIRNLFIIFTFCLTGVVCAQESQRKPVGSIIEVKGRAYLKEKGQKQKELTARDKDTLLYAGQELGCIKDCQVKFRIGRTEKALSKGRYIIPNLLKPKTRSDDDSIAAGSKTRTGSGILLSPLDSERGLARPESFKFSWRLLKINNKLINVLPLTLLLKDCKSYNQIWLGEEIEYPLGIYTSDEIRNLLKKRQRQDSAVSLEVFLTSPSLQDEHYCFNLISANEEKNLQAELYEWNNYAELIQHVERAYIFYRYKLYAEAADEYDMALNLSSTTDYLIADAIKTHYLVGNLERVKELLNQLKKLSSKSALYDEMLILTRPKN